MTNNPSKGREIKFRAWDKDFKTWTKNLVINWDGTLKAKRFDNSLTRADKAERFDIQLFTGLKDKNGKEIYEGDIVRSRVIYDEIDSASDYQDANLEVRWSMPELGWRVGYLPLTWSGFQSLEVIGNIMENPELVKESK